MDEQITSIENKPKIRGKRWIGVCLIFSLLLFVVAIIFPFVEQYRTLKRVESLGGTMRTEPGLLLGMLPTEWMFWIARNDDDQWHYALMQVRNVYFHNVNEDVFGSFSSGGLLELEMKFKRTREEMKHPTPEQVIRKNEIISVLNRLHHLQEIHLNYHCVTDDDLTLLAKNPDLKTLMLTGTKVTDTGLIHLRGLTKLECLSLEDTKVGDAGLKHIAKLTNLKILHLTDTKVTDAGLVHLKSLTNLSGLILGKTPHYDDYSSWLSAKKNSISLEEILKPAPITDAGLIHLKGLKNLQSLSLERTLISDKGLKHFATLPLLKIVYVKGTLVTEEGISRMQKSKPALEIWKY